MYTSLLTRFMKTESHNQGRLWLILRSMNKSGSGWVEYESLRELYDKANRHFLYSEKRLKGVLKSGHNTFWNFTGDRVYLFGLAKVAANIGCEHLYTGMVKVPDDILYGSICDFKAFCHDAKLATIGKDKLVSRTKIQSELNINKDTQRKYEKRMGTKVHKNYRIVADGYDPASENYQELIFLYGENFPIRTHKGTYTATKLANSYTSSVNLTYCGKRKRRELNKRIDSHLVNKCCKWGNNTYSKKDGIQKIEDCQILNASQKCYFEMVGLWH